MILRELRLKHNLTVPEAAAMVQVTDRTWRRWEAGDRTPPKGAVELFQIKLKEVDYPENPDNMVQGRLGLAGNIVSRLPRVKLIKI